MGNFQLSDLVPGNSTLFVIALLLGVVMHYCNQRTKGKTSSSFLAYWVSDNPGSSMATGMVLMIFAGTVLASPILVGANAWLVFLAALKSGYGIDSMVNSSGAVAALSADLAVPGKQAGFARLRLLILLAVFSFAGCAALASMFGVTQPKTPKQDLAYAYGELAASRTSILTAAGLGTISLAVEEKAEGYADQVRAGLNATRTAIGGCVDAKGAPVATVPGLVQAPVTGTAAAVFIVQQVACNQATTPVQQLALANQILASLSAYLAQQGVKR